MKRAMSVEERQEARLSKIEKQGEQFYEKYRPQMDLLDKSTLARVKQGKGGIQPHDYWALGKQLEQFEEQLAINEEQGNVNCLVKFRISRLTLLPLSLVLLSSRLLLRFNRLTKSVELFTLKRFVTLLPKALKLLVK